MRQVEGSHLLLPEPAKLGWSSLPLQGVLVSLQVHLTTETLIAKCGLLGVTMSSDIRKVTCVNCGRRANPKWAKLSRIHYQIGTRISCGRENVRTTKKWSLVSCKVCLSAGRPNRKIQRRDEPGYADNTYKGRGFLLCRNCGKPYAQHEGFQMCIPKEALIA